MKKVVGIGACVLDTLIVCDTYPDEDIKYRANKITKAGGGPVANALVMLAKMGVQAEFAGALSADADGHFLATELQRYGVQINHIRHIPETKAFTSYVLLSQKTGSRTCVYERGDVPDDPEQMDFSVLDGADILHLDGNSLSTALAAAQYAKEKGILVSLDAGGLYPGVEKLLPYVDILIPSEEFALGLTGKEDAQQAVDILQKKYNPKILAVTQGVRGGILYDKESFRHWESFPVHCVDSNGAGDTFHGAFLGAYLNGYEPYECCRIASAASAIKCTKVGMRDAIPSLSEILAFLESKRK